MALITKRQLKATLAGICMPAIFISIAHSEFQLNFIPADGSLSTSSLQGGEEDSTTLNGQTPFLFHGESLEIVTDPETGQRYYHMIVGSAAEGFLQESYIEVNSVPGAMELNAVGLLTSSGTITTDNGHDPLGILLDSTGTGNGQANPRQVIMRQIVSDGEIMMEFKKDSFEHKPVINQIQMAPDMTALFQIDMSNSTYDDDTTEGSIVNIQMFNDPFLSDIANFNMAEDGHKVDVNGGRYTHTEGPVKNGAQGTYQYIDGDFDVNNVRWEGFFDHSEDNPWGYPLLRPSE